MNETKPSKNLWFRFYWNDYLNDTAGLTLIQHGAYLALMLAYYRSGKPLPANLPVLYRMAGAFDDAEQTAVRLVVEQFFKVDDNVYRHNRIDAELADISNRRSGGSAGGSTSSPAKTAAARLNGSKGGRPPKHQPNDTQAGTQADADKPNGKPNENRTSSSSSKSKSSSKSTSTNTTQQNRVAKPATPGWVGLVFASHNHEPLCLSRNDKAAFASLIQQHGEATIKLAWEIFVVTGTYNADTKYPAYLFVQNIDQYLIVARERMDSHSYRVAHDPDCAARDEALVQQQKDADFAFMNSSGPPRNEADIFAYMADAGFTPEEIEAEKAKLLV